ncbi:hypothetical protein N657DRAFT_573982 [Parathielavia appendiculata]|uniref:Gelsolin n=1 Tax=Parathielavia appendiculata TaxID=2587402 RepID=A0AAN6Z3A9_9PEZI|nr:hypothetical protein N657DRAFT_573982 [Parathielavia appendiculata]
MSDEVSDFLRSVESLRERDEARSRELEEKILQEKRERQARREERARSISPQKSSPANTPPPTAYRVGIQPSEANGTALESPGLKSSGSPRQPVSEFSFDAMGSAPDHSSSPSKENESPFDSDIKRTSVTLPSPSIAVPSARSPLSWQRRPTSQASDRPKSRPLSMVAAENAARNFPGSSEPTEQTSSREQIVQTLAGKDPSWFRQTADPGRGSGAFRKTQVENQDTVDMPSTRTQLPGMSRELTAEPPKDSPVARPVTPTTLPAKLGSPLPLTGAQRLEPPVNDSAEDANTSSINRQSMTSPPGRTSPTRPLSPTKGMGGFVQSAMMKRSDSVKRWSVNSPAGLQRADSARSSVSDLDNGQRPTTPKSGVRPKSLLRRASEAPAPAEEKVPEPDEPVASVRPTTPAETTTNNTDEIKTPPTSPSKTMDSRRWSPTKSSSWLEAALNKPESPKAKPAPPAPTQPAWMAELNKAKAQKASADLARSASLPKKHEVKTGGLLRSTPMGTTLKPSALSGFPVVPPASTADKPAVGGLRGSLRKASPTPESPAESKGDLAATSNVEPEASSKKDFRANLKPRAPPPEAKKTDPADELKSVFGTLRRTKTQNYVAPDELKDNILRGKAGLNLTGGPKKTERKDEFKEAILKKKEEFAKAQQEGRSVTRKPGSLSEDSIPEGLAKKLELQRTGTVSKQSPTTPDFPLKSPILAESAHPNQISTRTSQKSADAPARIGGKIGGLADRFNLELAGLLTKGPPSASGPGNTGASNASATSQAESEPAGPGPRLTHLTKNRARGPRRKAPTSVAVPAEEAKGKVENTTSQSEEKASPLVPRRPSFPSLKPYELGSIPKEQTSPPKPSRPVISPRPEKFVASTPESIPPAASGQSADKPKTVGEVTSLIDSTKRLSKEEPKSVSQPTTLVGSTPVKTRPRSPTKVHEQVAALAALSQQSPKPAGSGEAASQPLSPKKLDMKRMSRFMDEQGQSSPKAEPASSKPSSPIKGRSDSLRSRPSSPASVSDYAELKPSLPTKSAGQLSSGTGLGLTQPTAAPEPVIDKSFAAERPSPLPAKISRPLPTPPAVSSPPVTSPRTTSPWSPGNQFSDATSLLSDFFGPERPRRKYTADAADILMRRSASTAKVQTQRAQLIQLTSEGKKIPVPSHYERVLFEREMYVCPHTYIDSTGKKVNEVYFWAGDEVPESEVDDAHLFAAREARAYGGKLVRLTQGKETSEFLQALGGIVIVRRGSSNKYDSLAPNLLCGRRYLGQVAFDEVDFSPLSLCSGFPYLITQNGKCYLWKGKGSDVEELGCAKLVGMDLALTGELIEVDEGSEPDSFWHMFGGGTRPNSADHWRLKPNYDKYCGRLFCANNAADEEQITELSPFSQTDLLPSNIYVLDAFFELYIIIGARSQHQYTAFRNALDFAQEYAILAAGMEDRPFVPIATVVLEGIPRDMKSVFRKWRDGKSPTVMHVPPPQQQTQMAQQGTGLKRARSLKIVPLTQALQALSAE